VAKPSDLWIGGLLHAQWECIYRGKVVTVFTLFRINNLSVYTKHYIFCKVFTSLAVKGLSVYIIVNVLFRVEFHFLSDARNATPSNFRPLGLPMARASASVRVFFGRALLHLALPKKEANEVN
jgi:hypothetical protein